MDDQIFTFVTLPMIQQVPSWYENAFPTGLPGKLNATMRNSKSLMIIHDKGSIYKWKDGCVFARIERGKMTMLLFCGINCRFKVSLKIEF